MAGVNKVILVGNLGRDPELRHTPQGQAVANFTMATSENWMGRDGQKQERTEWHRVVVWGKLAELCGKYLAKGRKAYIEGKLQTRSWDNKEGQKQYTTEIVANVVQFLDSAGAGAGASRSNDGFGAPSHGGGGDDPFGAPPDFGGGNEASDDIPF